MSEPRRSVLRSPWLVGTAALLAGLLLGAGIVTAGAQAEDPPSSGGRRAALQAFVACAEDAGIELPTLREVRQARRGGPPLGDAARAAVDEAREACGDLLPRAEERAAMRSCLTEAGVLPADGGRPDRSSMTDEERSAFRAAVRTCAEQEGITLPRRCRPGRTDR